MNEDDYLDDDDLEEEECPECGCPISGEDGDEDYEPDFCLICEDRDVPFTDRWKFHLVGDSGEEPEAAWICRTCHSKFDSVDDFENFRRNHTLSRLYRIAERLQRLLLLRAPASIIANTVFGSLAGAMFLSDDMGGSEEFRREAKKELAKRAEWIRRNP